jgi:hypothetical protein
MADASEPEQEISREGDTSGDAPTAERPPANDDRKPGETSTQRASKSVIVAVRRRSRFGEVPDLTQEELQRRRDAGDA